MPEQPDPGRNSTPWQDRVLGLLAGGALGDALGAPFEGSDRVLRRDVTGLLDSGGTLRWTDDTALQLALADHLADLGNDDDVDQDALALAFARAWEEEPWRGYGANPPRIFTAVLNGQDWRSVARESFGGSGSLGNGGAMRAAPLGALEGGPDRVATAARRSAAITHAHPLGQEGAVVVAVAVHHLLRTRPGITPSVDEVLGACAGHVSTPDFEGVLARVESAARSTDPRRAAEITGNGITAQEAVGAALCAALPRLGDPVGAGAFAVEMGGDTDTVAAMAGSMAGAFAGIGAFPQALLARLEGRERIQEVAGRLAARGRP